MKNLLKPILVAFVLIIIVIVVGSIMISKSMKEAGEKQQLNNNVVVNQVDANLTTTQTTNAIENNTVENEVVNNTVTNDVTENTVTNTTTTAGTGNIYEIYAKKQLAMPEVGEEIAIITVKDFGQIAVKFFPKVAPKAVENFVTHAKNGYYNGVTFHRVINEFMIQGGDPKGDGTGGETIWGKGISEELSNELVPYRGALMMASAGTGTSTIGSQFFIVQANYNPTMRKTLYNSGWSSDLLDAYRNHGGYMSLYGNYTLFGQVISGMDVVDKIAAVATAPDIDRPLSDVIIERIDVTTYQGQ